MRNKFTELIEQGVARFDYTPVAPELPEQDIICRTYNNVWSIPSDTHMSYCPETGYRYITGSMVGKHDKWERFKRASNWGAVNFRTTDWWSLCNFLQMNGLCGEYTRVNGDVAYEIKPIPTGVGCDCPDCPCACPYAYTTSESQIPENIGRLAVDGNVMKVKECYNEKTNLYDVAKSMNESIYVRGNEWTVVNDKLMCPIGNKVVIL